MLILQEYCIIFGSSAQPERLCGCYFCTQNKQKSNKEGDIMATAKKLPSGSWRCQVLSHTEEYTKPDGTIGKEKSGNLLLVMIQLKEASGSASKWLPNGPPAKNSTPLLLNH